MIITPGLCAIVNDLSMKCQYNHRDQKATQWSAPTIATSHLKSNGQTILSKFFQLKSSIQNSTFILVIRPFMPETETFCVIPIPTLLTILIIRVLSKKMPKTLQLKQKSASDSVQEKIACEMLYTWPLPTL